MVIICYLELMITIWYRARVIMMQVIRLDRLSMAPIRYLGQGMNFDFSSSNLRVSDVYTHIKSSPQDKINLVPPAPIPVQA